MNKPKQKKRIELKFLLILITLSLVALFIYLKNTDDNIKDIFSEIPFFNTTTEVVETINFDPNNKSSFVTLKNSYVHCTKDGVKYEGLSKWNDTYSYTAPIMISEGNIVAIYELKNRTIYVFNENGKMYECHTKYPIMQVTINRQGYLVAITKDNDRYVVIPYNNFGNPLSEGSIFEVEQNYPITADISEDGKHMAIGFLDTSYTYYESKILFINLSDKSQLESVDSISSSTKKQGEIIFSLCYMEDNNLIAISDKRIIGIDKNFKISWEKPLTNELTALDVSDNKFIALGLGNELPGGSEYKSGTVTWYDLTGKEIGNYELNKEVKKLNVKSNRILIYSGRSIYCLTRKGTLLWEYPVTQDVVGMMLFEDLSHMIVVYKNSVQIINIKAKSNTNTTTNNEDTID